MESDLLALHWMEHSKVFSQAIGNLRTKTSYTDATLACEGHFYPVHKFVLSTCSQYFNAIFEWTPCVNPVVVINNVTSKDLEALLDFMYMGEVSVKESVIPDIMAAADCLRIRGLSVLDDDGVKSTLKNKSNTDSGGPVRKRRRTSVSKKKISIPAPESIPSTSQPSESKSLGTVSPSTSASDHLYNNEENFNHAENHASDCSPMQQSQRHISESENYDTDQIHPSQNNASANFVQAQLSLSPQPDLTIHPTYNAINNQHCKISPPYVPTPSHSSALDLSSHEQVSDAPVHCAVDAMKSEKIEFEKTKPHVPPTHGIVSSEEIPDLLDTLVDMRPQYDTKSEPEDEVATIHAVEPNENLYDFTEDLPSVSATPPPHQEVRYQTGPATSSSSKKVDQNSTEEDPACKCTSCGKQFSRKEGLRRHMRIHNKEPYACNQCPFTSSTYRGCLDHKKKEHAVVLKCSLCDFSTDRNDLLRRHVAGHDKPHKCPECKFSTARIQNLQKHIKNRHEKNKT